MSFSSLHIGASALYSSQRAVEVASHNVANANTPGYTRQRLEVQTAYPTPGTPGLRGDGMRGMGTTLVSIERLRDGLADVAYRSEAGVAGAAAARSAALARTESVLGPYAEGAPEAMSRFLASWDELALDPAEPAARSGVLASGAALADSLRTSAEGLDDVQHEIGLRVTDQVAELNSLLADVGRLNLVIQDAKVSGSSPNDLLDRRDEALDRITYLSGARVERGAGSGEGTGGGNGEGNMVRVVLGDTTLVQAGAVTRVDAGGTPLALSVGGAPLAATGQLGGYLSVIIADIPAYRQQLDAVAAGLRDAVNAVHAGGTDLTGVAGAAFFTGATARELRLAPLTEEQVAASRTGRSGDGENALAMSALRTAPAVGSATVAEALRGFAGRIGQAVIDARRGAATSDIALAGATAARAAVNGVNVDEEMVDLVKFQHAYSAAARVISTVDDMLDTIINRMGR